MAEQTSTLRITAVDATRQAFRSVEQGVKGLQSAVSSLSRVASGVGLAALGAVFVDAIGRASDAERAINSLNATLKATGFAAGQTAGDVRALARELAKSSVFDDDEILKSLNALLRFRDVQGAVFKDAARLLPDIAAAMGTGDLVSAAQAVGKALTAPGEGMRALKDLGINLSASQSELAKKMAETGRVVEAQAIVMEAITKAVGGAAAGENQGLYGSTKALSKAWDEFLKKIGGAPVVRAGSLGFVQGMTESLEKLMAMMEQASNKFQTLGQSIKPSPVSGAEAFAEFTASVDKRISAAERASAIFGKLARDQQVKEEAALAAGKKGADEASRSTERRAAAIKGLTERLDDQLATELKLTEVEKARRELEKIGGASQAQRAAIEQRAGDLDRIRTDQELMERSARNSAAVFDEQADLLRDQADAARELRIEMEAEAEAVKRQVNPIREITQEYNKLAELQKAGLIDSEEAAKRAQQLRAQAAEIEGVGKVTKETNDVARELGFTFQSAFEDAVLAGEKFSDVLEGIGQDLARLVLRKSITEPIAGAISTGVSGIIASLAVGTPYVPRDMLAMVHKGEAIIPAAENTGKRGGGGGVTIVQNNRVDSTTDKSSIIRMMQMARESAKADIMRSMKRGGAFARG